MTTYAYFFSFQKRLQLEQASVSRADHRCDFSRE